MVLPDHMRTVTIHPEARLTPNNLAEVLRELSGNRCAPSARKFREAIVRGELRAKREGHWTWIRWADALAYLEGDLAVCPDEQREQRARQNAGEACRRGDSLTA